MVDCADTGGQLRPLAVESPADSQDEPLLDRRAAPRKRLTIEVSADLHRRILMLCATRRVPVNQAVREILDRSFPGS